MNYINRIVFNIIILCFCTIAAYSQEKSVERSSYSSTEPILVARDYVKLLPGYTLKATTNATLHAYTNEDLICDVDPITPISIDNRTVDESLPVGSTTGAVNVSPTGAAIYQIPIYTPPGTNAMMPQISITYNSQAGDGLLGRGWDISGLSAIYRVSQNINYDSQVKGVTFVDYHDRFSLDANRLILNSGNWGITNSTYKTETESLSTIQYETNYTPTGSYFTVNTKDFSTLEYGKTSDSKVIPTGAPNPVMWRLNRVEDVFHNYMTYTYRTVDGETFIDRIDYTGNTVEGLTPYNSIEFYYENKSDIKTNYIAGYPIPKKVILYSINLSSILKKH
jgi:hypothetical protein